jgi:hypothetical protein
LAALVELTVGFLRVEPKVGRAGGLLRVVPVVLVVDAVDGIFKSEEAGALGFVVEVAIVRFGMEPAFSFGGVGLASDVCSSILSTGSSIED